jgi:hypothetical protein
MNVVARSLGYPKVKGQWIVSNCYISGISQIYYLKIFNMPVESHRLKSTLVRLIDVAYDDIKFGPLKRGRKRMMSLDEHGYIPNSIAVKDLSIAPEKFTERVKDINHLSDTPLDAEDFFEELGLD